MTKSEKRYSRFKFLWALGALALALQAGAQGVRQRNSPLDDLKFARPELRLAAQHQDLNEARAETSAPVLGAFDTFLRNEGMTWRAVFDRVTGRPALIEGQGIPWIPGKGNHLKLSDLGLSKRERGGSVPLRVVEARAADFLERYPDLLGVDPHDLSLVPGASGPISDYLYFLDFQWRYHGIPVENAHVVFRINHGNMVQFGQENISPAIASLDPSPTISVGTAWEILRSYIGGEDPGDRVVEMGRLLVVPALTPQAASGAMVAAGTGMEYRLVYVLSFERDGVLGTWEARVDAHSGEVLSFRDANDYGKVHGGVYPLDRLQPETDRPLPFADVGGGNFANQQGFFAGNSGASTLGGKYVAINEHCGSISGSTTTGDISFGSSAGTDCTTPGVGGSGNTHAARSAFYAINLVKEKARGYLPGNAWLNGNLAVEVDISPYCNAFSNGSGLHFYQSVAVNPPGSTCNNSGEFATVVTHEFGHQFDSNDGNGFSPDNGTGEAYADTTFMLQLHSSCIGNGLYTNPSSTLVCGGYGNQCTACSGWRDMDYANHSSPTPSTPDMLNAGSGYNCGSPNPGYPGPCGYEGHCEGVIIGQAVWDFATRDLTAMGLDAGTAWQIADRLWFFSRSTATAAYACPTLSTTDGCGAGSMYAVFRVADDCDGNLANGTPHAAAIFAATKRHHMSCGLVGDATNQNQAGCCPSFSAPTVSLVLGTNQVTVNWTAVGGAVTYSVFRNEVTCTSGYTLIGAVVAPTLSFTDNTAVGGVTYFYRVQAVGSSTACSGPLSACSAIGGLLSANAGGAPTSGVAPFTVNFTGAASNGTPPYTYAWDFGDGNTGAGATPSHVYSSLGIFTVKLTVTDSASPALVLSPPTFTIKSCGNMTATPATLATETAGTYYSVAFTGGGGVGPYTLTMTGALPTGVTFDSPTATLSGTPMQLGTFPVTLHIKDTNGCLTDLPYSLTVVCPVVTISPTSLLPCLINKKYCQQLTASGCVGSCSFSLLSGALPPGLTMDGTGYISGIPTAHGAFTFTVRATTILGCHGDQAYTLKDFDLVLIDDSGRSRFYADRSTGAYEWDILTGPGTGSYSGVAAIQNGGAKIVSTPGSLYTLNVTYDPVKLKATGYFITGSVYSGLSDSNTGNDVPICP
jgi:trimeric autotransporter adhesin